MAARRLSAAPAVIVALALTLRLAAWYATLPTPLIDDEAGLTRVERGGVG